MAVQHLRKDVIDRMCAPLFAGAGERFSPLKGIVTERVQEAMIQHLRGKLSIQQVLAMMYLRAFMDAADALDRERANTGPTQDGETTAP